MSAVPLLVVHWRSLATGATGHGEPIPAPSALLAVDAMNKQYAGSIFHWTEPGKVPAVSLVDGKVQIEGAS